MTSLHLYTIILIAGIVFIGMRFSGNGYSNTLNIICVFFLCICYAGFGQQMNYFEISGEVFIIRNHYFPWKKTEINIDEILQANLEKYHHRRSYGLRIITSDYKSRLFYAGSLWGSTWDELFTDLGSMGVKT